MPCEFKFEDLNAYNAGAGYVVPNEQRERWEGLLKSLPIYKAAAICSGGEVGFLTLLPRVRQELVLVDHSYESLGVAIAKYLALREWGAETTYKLFTSKSDRKILAELSGLTKQFPDTLRRGFDSACRYLYEGDQRIKREWSKTPLKRVKIVCTKLDKVKFVHGDLTDLTELGPFGLLYLSNALEHLSRTRKQPVVKDVEKAVRPGGYVLNCVDPFRFRSQEWEEVDSADGDTNGGYLKWSYRLNRVPCVA